MADVASSGQWQAGDVDRRSINSDKDLRQWVAWLLGIIIIVLSGYIKIQSDIKEGDIAVSRTAAEARQEQSLQMKEIRDELRALNAYLRDNGHKP